MIYHKSVGPILGTSSLRLYTAIVLPTRKLAPDEVEVLSIIRGPDIEEISINRHVMKIADIEGEGCTAARLLADLSMMTGSIEAQI